MCPVGAMMVGMMVLLLVHEEQNEDQFAYFETTFRDLDEREMIVVVVYYRPLFLSYAFLTRERER
jgi:hypothetical protein